MLSSTEANIYAKRLPSYLPKTPLPQHHEEIEVCEFHSVKVVGWLLPVFGRADDFVTCRAELGFLKEAQTRKVIGRLSSPRKECQKPASTRLISWMSAVRSGRRAEKTDGRVWTMRSGCPHPLAKICKAKTLHLVNNSVHATCPGQANSGSGKES